VNGALLFLTVRSAANRTRRRAAQLRNPRYAVAFLLGLAFLWMFVARRQPDHAGAVPSITQHRELLMAILVSWAVAWTWAFGSRRIGLSFSLAEVDFLFPSPLARPSLVRFKLLHAQGRVLWSTLVWTLLVSRSAPGSMTFLHAVGVWTLLTTLQLHRLGASFTRVAVTRHGRAGLARRWVTLAVVALTATAALVVLAAAAPAVAEALRGGGTTLLGALTAAADTPLARGLLAPFRMLVRPIAAHDARSWVRAILPALAILVAHFVWATCSDVAFEESAAEAARRRAAALPARAPGAPAPGGTAARPVFQLSPVGNPAVAVFWKNITAVARVDRVRRTAAGFLFVAAAVAVLSLGNFGRIAPILGALAGTWAAFSILIGPQWVRNDLRSDLPHLELLRSYPVTGAQLVAAEVAASTVLLTLLQLMLASLAYVAFLGDPAGAVAPDVRLWLLLGGALLLPAVNYLGLLLLNGGALLYPAWVRTGPGRAAGVEGLGQNVLSIVAYGVALLVALVPPVAVGGAVTWALQGTAGGWASLPGAGIALGVIILECRLLVPPLGRTLERIDLPSSGIEPG
jgi:hypothetical protein